MSETGIELTVLFVSRTGFEPVSVCCEARDRTLYRPDGTRTRDLQQNFGCCLMPKGNIFNSVTIATYFHLMFQYKYTSNDFALSDEGVHLLRNGFNYKTINFDEVKQVSIKKAVAVKNPILSLIFGIFFVFLSIIQFFRVYLLFQDPTASNIYIESIVVAVLPLFVGLYMVYVSFKKELLLLVATESRTTKLSVKAFQTQGKLEEVEAFISEKLGSYVWV